jgi:predicted RNA-binding protein Jag
MIKVDVNLMQLKPVVKLDTPSQSFEANPTIRKRDQKASNKLSKFIPEVTERETVATEESDRRVPTSILHEEIKPKISDLGLLLDKLQETDNSTANESSSDNVEAESGDEDAEDQFELPVLTLQRHNAVCYKKYDEGFFFG